MFQSEDDRGGWCLIVNIYHSHQCVVVVVIVVVEVVEVVVVLQLCLQKSP